MQAGLIISVSHLILSESFSNVTCSRLSCPQRRDFGHVSEALSKQGQTEARAFVRDVCEIVDRL